MSATLQLLLAAAGQSLQRVQASDNFKNLFEVPVLFWLYVALRYVHSLIHLTYNRVTHRVAVYALSTAILFVLWGGFAVRVLP